MIPHSIACAFIPPKRIWIIEREEKKPRKGRPNKIYSLRVVFKDIIAQLEKQQRKAVDESQAKIERLKDWGYNKII
jgi:predicted transcriptional regulator